MQTTDILARMGSLQSMARELGISESQAARGAEALLDFDGNGHPLDDILNMAGKALR